MTSPKPDLMFKAFADPTRLRILHLLTHGELCVCDIMAVLKAPQARVSRHLAYLRRARLAQDRKQGLWRHYSLVKGGGLLERGLLHCLRGCFNEVSVLRRDTERLQAIRRRKEREKGRLGTGS
jgi:ArsR family transcriptional regulator